MYGLAHRSRTAGPGHFVRSEQGFLQLALALEARGASLTRPAVRTPSKDFGRWYDGAAQRGHCRVLQLALDRGEPPVNCLRALCVAARHGQEAAVRLLLARGVPPMYDALKAAFLGGKPGMAHLLLDLGVQVETTRAALYEACEQQHPDWVRLLLQHGAGEGQELRRLVNRVFAKDGVESCPGRSQLGTVRVLLGFFRPGELAPAGERADEVVLTLEVLSTICGQAEARAVEDSWLLTQPGGESFVLRAAARRGDLERVEEMLGRGADVTAYDARALVEAAFSGRPEVVERLLRTGAAFAAAQVDAAIRKRALGLPRDAEGYEICKARVLELLLAAKGAAAGPARGSQG